MAAHLRVALLLSTIASVACLPERFDALAEAAPVTTVGLSFPAQPEATLAIALTVAADDEGRGRVLFGDGVAAIGWFRIDEREPDLRFATFEQLATLADHEQPTLTGLAVVGEMAVAEGLVRVAAREASRDRVVRFRVADFSRPSAAELDMIIYPWVSDAPPSLTGPLAAVQLDEDLPEVLSASSEGLWIWDSLGTRASEYADARAALLADDPTIFDADPRRGYGLTHCPGQAPTALAGGRLLANQGKAAVALEAATLTFVGLADGAEPSLIGAPIYDCELATLELPDLAASLLVVDLERDGSDDLLVGAPERGEVWIYENHGDGLASVPTRVLASDDERSSFGASLAHVELGGDAPEVFVVGAPSARVGGKADVGRVHVFDASDGELLLTIEDLEPTTHSQHGLAVHGLDLPGREELLVSGARELRIHWALVPGDPRP